MPLTLTQQTDMRGLLEPLCQWLKDASSLCAEAEVLVGPNLASIFVPTGEAPPERDKTAANNYSQKRAYIVSLFTRFLQESYSTGSPLMQQIEEGPDGITAKYQIIPNDILSAEKNMKNVLDRLKTHAEITAFPAK